MMIDEDFDKTLRSFAKLGCLAWIFYLLFWLAIIGAVGAVIYLVVR